MICFNRARDHGRNGIQGYLAAAGFGRHLGGEGGMRGGRGGGPGGNDPRGRGRRMFDGGELRLVLLKLIADEPRHGYDLIRRIDELTGGAYAPSPGIVYPTITLLDEMGLIGNANAEAPRKRYEITSTGTAHLEANHDLVELLFARLSEVGSVRERTDGAPIRRAMGNLRQVLHHRLGGEGVELDAIHAVAALIDEAAQKIERLR